MPLKAAIASGVGPAVRSARGNFRAVPKNPQRRGSVDTRAGLRNARDGAPLRLIRLYRRLARGTLGAVRRLGSHARGTGRVLHGRRMSNALPRGQGRRQRRRCQPTGRRPLLCVRGTFQFDTLDEHDSSADGAHGGQDPGGRRTSARDARSDVCVQSLPAIARPHARSAFGLSRLVPDAPGVSARSASALR
jgi:hypothetical protein